MDDMAQDDQKARIEKLRKQYARRRSLYHIGMALCIVGVIPVVFSWIQIVSPDVGHFGYFLTIAGVIFNHAAAGAR